MEYRFADLSMALDAYHQFPNHIDKQIGMESTEQPPSRMSLIECRNGIETLTDIDFSSLSGKWVRGETMEAAQKVKEYLDSRDTELAYRIKEGYFSIQTVSSGYDYTIYNNDFREIDGGVYDNPDISMREVMEIILTDAGISAVGCKVMDYEELQEKADAVSQEDLQKVQEKAKRLPLISDQTEPEPALNGQSRAGIEETVLCYAQAQIDEMGLTEEVELLGARVYGSRSREGLYRVDSDIDVVLSYSGNLKEDAFFHALHEDGLKVAGIPVDINPISIEKTGTLEEYLESADKYLDERQKSLEAVKENAQTEPEEAITFYAAECSEFPVPGEYHEGLETLQEAMDLYEKIPAERMNGIKGIGFCLEDGSIYDGTFDLMVAGEVQKEFISEIPHYRESRLVQKAIADMEAILSEREGRHKPEPQKESKAPEPEKTAETALKTDRNQSADSKKQSVLNALREWQARMKAQEKQRQKSQTDKKGEQEL